MAFKFLLILAIVLVISSKVFSFHEDVKMVVNYATPPATSPPSPLVKSPPAVNKAAPPPPLVKSPPYQSPPFSPPIVKKPPSPPPTPIVKKPPSPTPPPAATPIGKTPPSPYSPPVKPPTVAPTPPTVKPPTPIVKKPPYSPPQVKPPTVAPAAPPTPLVKSIKDCIPLCDYRCQLHSRKKLCVRACMTCCDRCKCVPPGTYGNKEKCGKCYTDMLTHGNKYKCP